VTVDGVTRSLVASKMVDELDEEQADLVARMHRLQMRRGTEAGELLHLLDVGDQLSSL
jgi:hypothetical protein